MHKGRNIAPQATGERNFKIPPYVVVSDHGYTKHYYAGTERVAARVGGGFGKAVLHEQQEGLTRQARDLFHQSLGSIQARRPLAVSERSTELNMATPYSVNA